MNKYYYILAAILFLAAFLRFYHLGEIAKFEFDDQYNSFLVFDLVKNHHLSLIGQQGSFGGIYWGPWHYLYLVPFYLLTNLHPIGGFIGEGVLGLLTVASYFFVGRKLFSPTVGVLVAFLRAILFTLIINDLTISPAYPSELVAIWFFYFLVKLKEGWANSFIILSFLFGMMFSVHVVLFPLILVWFLVLLIYKPIKYNLRMLIWSCLAFLVPVMPLILFEVRHRFDHVRLFINTLIGDGRTTENSILEKFEKVLTYNIDSFYRIFDKWILPSWLGLVVLGLIMYFFWKKRELFKNSYYLFLLLSTLVITILYYTVYPRNVPEYYYLGLTPLILLFMGAFLVDLAGSKIGKVIFIIFFSIIIYTNVKLYVGAHNTQGKFSLNYKDAAVSSIVNHQKGKGEYSVSYIADFGRNYGFQYLFLSSGFEPRKYVAVPAYTIVVPVGLVSIDDLSETFGSIGVIYPEDEPEQGKNSASEK